MGIDGWNATHGKIVSGFGHRFHKPNDPRAPRIMALIREAASRNIVSGKFAEIAEAVQREIAARRGGRPIAMNIDGSTAAVFCELGFLRHFREVCSVSLDLWVFLHTPGNSLIKGAK